MSGTSSNPTTQKARKGHRCSWCGEPINPGEEYTRWRYYGDDGVGTVKMHPECEAAQQREVDQGGENEFTPYEQERGRSTYETEEAQRAA